MIRAMLAFVLGAVIGNLICMVPFFIGSMLGLTPCVESCPNLFRLGLVAIYAAMTVCWGTLFVFAFGKSAKFVSRRTLLIAFGFSNLFVTLYVSFAYARHALLI